MVAATINDNLHQLVNRTLHSEASEVRLGSVDEIRQKFNDFMQILVVYRKSFAKLRQNSSGTLAVAGQHDGSGRGMASGSSGSPEKGGNSDGRWWKRGFWLG